MCGCQIGTQTSTRPRSQLQIWQTFLCHLVSETQFRARILFMTISKSNNGVDNIPEGSLTEFCSDLHPNPSISVQAPVICACCFVVGFGYNLCCLELNKPQTDTETN